jgi:hypothetical protein
MGQGTLQATWDFWERNIMSFIPYRLTPRCPPESSEGWFSHMLEGNIPQVCSVTTVVILAWLKMSGFFIKALLPWWENIIFNGHCDWSFLDWWSNCRSRTRKDTFLFLVERPKWQIIFFPSCDFSIEPMRPRTFPTPVQFKRLALVKIIQLLGNNFKQFYENIVWSHCPVIFQTGFAS